MNSSPHNNFGLLRLLLATLVVLGHFRTLYGPAPAHGIFDFADLAISAFFVISGYLVFASFDRQAAVGAFYCRRLFRIYPLYLVTILAQGLIMAALAGGIAAHGACLLRYLGLNMVMANFLAHDIDGLLSGAYNPGINPSLWTLKIELAFYLILPLLWYLTRRFGAIFFILTYIGSIAYVAVMQHYEASELARQLPGQMSFFITGIALYRYRQSLRIYVPLAAALALLLFGLCTLRHEPFFIPFYPLCLGLLVFICAERLPARPLPLDISYGVYLFHGPLIQFALLLGIFEDNAYFLLPLLAIVYLLAFAAERFVERPGIALGKRLAQTWAHP